MSPFYFWLNLEANERKKKKKAKTPHSLREFLKEHIVSSHYQRELKNWVQKHSPNCHTVLQSFLHPLKYWFEVRYRTTCSNKLILRNSSMITNTTMETGSSELLLADNALEVLIFASMSSYFPQELTSYLCPWVLQFLPCRGGHKPHISEKWQEQRRKSLLFLQGLRPQPLEWSSESFWMLYWNTFCSKRH